MRYLRHLISVILLAGVQSAFAADVRLTIYDDGLSCPANCDAHVVFHHTLNGTEFAHDPKSTQGSFTKCTPGVVCRLCLQSGGRQCLEAIYRGGGPSPMTFDFTPAFYSQACEGNPSQPSLAAKCKALKKAAAELAGRTNCIATPNVKECAALIEAATNARRADRVNYDQCIKEGQATYNAARPKREQRTLRCAYERFGKGGPNSKGTTWKKLLPGACRDGTLVGRDGLDCCSGNTFADGPLGRECAAFYPPAPSG